MMIMNKRHRMSNLDDKLKEAIRYIANEDGYAEIEDLDVAIAKIKQAFKDEGYLPFKPYGEVPEGQKQPEWWSKTPTIMTGQEWYYRFEKLVFELNPKEYPSDIFYRNEILELAKKASSIDK